MKAVIPVSKDVKEKLGLRLGSLSRGSGPGYWLRYPWLRIAVVLTILMMNLLIFVEDPTFHSVLEVDIPVAGQCVSLALFRWPPSAGWIIVKVLCLIVSATIGALIGKFILHKRVFKRWLRLKLFKDNQGSFFCMGICAGPMIFVGSQIYNFLIMWGMDNYEPYLLTGKMVMDNMSFGKLTMIGTWLGDTTTLFMVVDMMLQDKKRYPNWAVWLRGKWDGWFRVGAFWIFQAILYAVVLSLVLSGAVDWASAGFGSTEFGRGALALFVACLDIAIVAQDWEFPRFKSSTEVKLPGLPMGNVKCSCTKNPAYDVVFTGKWVNYGTVILIMMLDFNNLYSQLSYLPLYFGQYVDNSGVIYAIMNLTEASDPENLNYTLRQEGGFNDTQLDSKYLSISFAFKLFLIIPAVIVGLGFLVGTYLGNRRVSSRKKLVKDDEIELPESQKQKKKKKKHYGTMDPEEPHDDEDLVDLDGSEDSSSIELQSDEDEESHSNSQNERRGLM